MLYGNESISQYSPGNVAIWMAMAFQAGTLNIGGFMACHRFVSHITGFATFFGLEVSRANREQAIGMLIVPLFFLFGSMLSGLMVEIRLKLHKRPRYYITFGTIFILLTIVFVGGISGDFGAFGEPLLMERDYLLLILLCLVCGIQNGSITSLSKSVVRTTHLTGITTDLGIGIIRYFHRHRLPDYGVHETRSNWIRFGLILFFAFGSVAGAFAFSQFQYAGFGIPVMTSGLLFLLMFYFQTRKA